jgi:hypothetical protein
MYWDGLKNKAKSGTLPPYWDGLAAKCGIFRGMGWIKKRKESQAAQHTARAW